MLFDVETKTVGRSFSFLHLKTNIDLCTKYKFCKHSNTQNKSGKRFD